MRGRLRAAIAVITSAILLLAGCGRWEEGAAVSGTLEATEIRLAPALAGRVLEARAERGRRVAAGDTLLVLDTELLLLQREETAARDEVLRAQLSAARLQQERAAAERALAERTHARLRVLADQGSASEQQLDEARSRRDQAAAIEESGRHAVDALAAELRALRTRLAVQDRRIADGVLLSPLSGTVLERYAHPGEWIAPGSPAFLLADLERLMMRIYLDETDVDLVGLGGRIPLRLDALPGEDLAGVVRWISPQAEFTPKNAQTRRARTQLVFAVELEVANPGGRLHLGMPGEALLEDLP